MHGDHIHITFAQDQIWLSGCTSHIQPIQVTAFVKDLCLRGIQVLGLSISHDPAAKTNHPVIHIHNWENNSVPEFVIHSMTLIHIKQTAVPQLIVTISLAFQKFVKVIAELVRVPKAKFPDGFIT